MGATGVRPQTPLIRDDEVLRLAELAHEWWSARQLSKPIALAAEESPGKTTPYLCTFAERPVAIERLIINRVEQIPVILHDAGLEIFHPHEQPDFTDAAMIDVLAEILHGSYQNTVDAEIASRRAAGFLPNSNSNAIPFARLAAARQESNRDYIRTIPRKLGRLGLTLKPRDPSATGPSVDPSQASKPIGRHWPSSSIRDGTGNPCCKAAFTNRETSETHPESVAGDSSFARAAREIEPTDRRPETVA